MWRWTLDHFPTVVDYKFWFLSIEFSKTLNTVIIVFVLMTFIFYPFTNHNSLHHLLYQGWFKRYKVSKRTTLSRFLLHMPLLLWGLDRCSMFRTKGNGIIFSLYTSRNFCHILLVKKSVILRSVTCARLKALFKTWKPSNYFDI